MPSSFSFMGRLRSMRHALHGIQLMLVSQQNAWVHASVTAVVLALGLSLGLDRFEWCWLVIACVAVWTAEGLNTAFELMCDVASPEFHPSVKCAKDVAAGAVLIAAVGAAIIGLLILGPPLVALFES
jgi:diacylglycerol kinase (ATP)